MQSGVLSSMQLANGFSPPDYIPLRLTAQEIGNCMPALSPDGRFVAALAVQAGFITIHDLSTDPRQFLCDGAAAKANSEPGRQSSCISCLGILRKTPTVAAEAPSLCELPHVRCGPTGTGCGRHPLLRQCLGMSIQGHIYWA